MSTAASVAVGPAIRRARWTTLGAVILAVFGGALVVASQRAAGYVGPVALVAGVGEISLAALLLLRVRHAGGSRRRGRHDRPHVRRPGGPRRDDRPRPVRGPRGCRRGAEEPRRRRRPAGSRLPRRPPGDPPRSLAAR